MINQTTKSSVLVRYVPFCSQCVQQAAWAVMDGVTLQELPED